MKRAPDLPGPTILCFLLITATSNLSASHSIHSNLSIGHLSSCFINSNNDRNHSSGLRSGIPSKFFRHNSLNNDLLNNYLLSNGHQSPVRCHSSDSSRP